MNHIHIFLFAIGILVANWLLIPLIRRGRTHTDGLFIGIIAALLFIGVNFALGKLN